MLLQGWHQLPCCIILVILVQSNIIFLFCIVDKMLSSTSCFKLAASKLWDVQHKYQKVHNLCLSHSKSIHRTSIGPIELKIAMKGLVFTIMVQFFNTWLKPFGRMVPVGREVALKLRLKSTSKRTHFPRNEWTLKSSSSKIFFWFLYFWPR